MLLTLEKAGLISRQPGAARSIAVQVDRADLPTLNPGYAQPVKTSVQKYFSRPAASFNYLATFASSLGKAKTKIECCIT
ncbi:MAG: hypothetical protein WKF40_09825 [Thermoleophilaceae bacterium]